MDYLDENKSSMATQTDGNIYTNKHNQAWASSVLGSNHNVAHGYRHRSHIHIQRQRDQAKQVNTDYIQEPTLWLLRIGTVGVLSSGTLVDELIWSLQVPFNLSTSDEPVVTGVLGGGGGKGGDCLERETLRKESPQQA